MSKAEHTEVWTQPDPSNYTSYPNTLRLHSSKHSTIGNIWVLIVSLLILPLLSATLFALQGSPEALRWIINIINSLF